MPVLTVLVPKGMSPEVAVECMRDGQTFDEGFPAKVDVYGLESGGKAGALRKLLEWPAK